MIDTVLLVPPGFGPRANPLLFGVSEGLMRLFPLPMSDQPPGAGSATAGEARPDSVPAPIPAASDA